MSKVLGARALSSTGIGYNAITSFTGPYAFLSNFLHPCPVEHEGILYTSSEHAYQAAKTVLWEERHTILAAPTPAKAKRAGRTVTLRPEWEHIKRAVMLTVVLAKFVWNPDLAQRLAATGDRALLEGNWWGDTYWGVVAENHPRFSGDLPWWHDSSGRVWAGHNWLGISLVTAREVLRPEGS